MHRRQAARRLIANIPGVAIREEDIVFMQDVEIEFFGGMNADVILSTSQKFAQRISFTMVRKTPSAQKDDWFISQQLSNCFLSRKEASAFLC